MESVPQRGSVWLDVQNQIHSHTLPRCGTDYIRRVSVKEQTTKIPLSINLPIERYALNRRRQLRVKLYELLTQANSFLFNLLKPSLLVICLGNVARYQLLRFCR